MPPLAVGSLSRRAHPRLADRSPRVGADRLVAELVPPPHFGHVSFASYLPDPAQPTQGRARAAVEAFAAALQAPTGRRRWRRRAGAPAGGLYLDGGFGVGKTHLLAALWHAAPRPATYGTFVEYTQLVGALGFARAVELLSAQRLVCVDEFELDDPGDTVLMSTLLRRLADAGVALAATSNTLPEAQGEGRFSAEDFQREIQGLAARFAVVTIDGEDYRHRALASAGASLPAPVVAATAAAVPGATLDDFDALTAHLAEVHPSRYGALVDGVRLAAWTGVHPLADQAVALRLVVLVDRLYDRDVPLLAAGGGLDEVFTPDLLAGGYRKKYRRALSRLAALSAAGRALVAAGPDGTAPDGA